ncbi:uncharacterized protein LOC114532546 isoform X2 [Dendronephthya gigantea]|nr:uncharacterized protein LOC114532546 isoform X2 [Dendronephthya gigantea]
MRGLYSLRKLDLSGCGLTEVLELEYLDKLEELNLSNNPLRMSDWKMRGLYSLRKLDLSGCGLTEVPVVKYPDELEELNLSNNHIDHQDLLQKFSSRKSSHISNLKPLEPIAGFFRPPNLRRVIFEDGAYIYLHLKGLNEWIWQEADGKLVKENWLDEFIRLAKSESGKLTIETYHHMLKSLNVVRSLVGDNVESCLDRASTFNQCCLEILNYLPGINVKGSRNSYSKECLIDLQSGVSLLKFWSSGSDDDKYILKQVMTIYKITVKSAFEAFSRMSVTADGGTFATMLKIVSEVLLNLTKPETVVIRCLQFLQELHDLPVIQDMFSFLIANDKQMSFLIDDKKFLNVLSVHKMNKILYEFVRVFVKPPPTVEEWPATIQLREQVYNPLIEEQFLKERLMFNNRPVSSQMESDIDKIIGTDENVEGQNTDVVEYNDPIIESNLGTSVNSIIVKAEGGCFGIPVASAFLFFPPQAVEDEITLTCSRVKHKDSEVKPRDAVSQILKIEPEGVTFKKPVTVLLSHSAYEDEVFKNFYELIVERFRPTKDSTDPFPTGWLELKTGEISSSKDLPKGIRNPKIMEDYLPFAKATIQETCTLVATTRIRSDQVLIPTRKSYTFCKHYGKNTELKITFPAGVTDSLLSLKIQLLPAEVVLNKDMRLNENLVCGPVIRVSGQKVLFLNPVDVELTYSHEDVTNISEEFLPVKSKIKFTTKYGLLLRSKKVEEKWEKLNESIDVHVERLRKDQLKFSFAVKHFSDYVTLMNMDEGSSVDSSKVSPVVNTDKQARHLAFVLAVHKIDDIQNTLHAVLMPKLEKRSVETKWKVDAIHFMDSLTSGEPIFFCAPLSESLINYHLPLMDYTLRFDPDTESELPNNTAKNVDLRGKFMRFLKDNECNNGTNHSTQGDCRAKAPIHVSETISVQATTEQHKSTLDSRCTRELNVASGQESPLRNRQISEVINVMIDHCELFQRSVEIRAQKELEIATVTKDPKAGKMTKVVDVAGPAATVLFSLACGITVATGFATFGIASFCGAVVAGGTLIVKSVDKHKKQANVKRFVQTLDEAAKRERAHVSSYLNCLVKDIAKELCRIFEYQLFHLKSEKEVTILAESAVDLMLNLKKNDVFDRNTLLKNVLLNGEAKKRELLTYNDEKWFAPDVFRKPGLRRVIIGTNSTECVYKVKLDGTCDTKKYGYRGQFLEIMEYGGENEEATSDAMTVDDENSKFKLCEKCQDCCSSGKYFLESEIDREYTKPCQEALIYRPLHLLVQCPEVIYSFSDTLQENRSFADFLKTKIGIQDNEMLLPVYRQHVPGTVLNLSLNKANLTGSDFSYSNFGDSFLLGCDFTKCVMLFATLFGAKMSRSTFLDTFISHSDLREVKADGCSWTKTSVLHSRVDNADLSHAVPTVGDNHWDGTNLCDAIISRPVEPLNVNGGIHLMEIPKGQMSYV